MFLRNTTKHSKSEFFYSSFCASKTSLVVLFLLLSEALKSSAGKTPKEGAARSMA